MRTSILLIALTGFLAFSPANAGPDNGKRQDNGRGAYMKAAAANHCSDLVGTTRGLHGLCMAYCAQTDLSQVDLNDTESLRAAGPSIEILRKYNERRRPADPEMPCFKNTDDGDDGDDGDDNGDGDDGGTTLPPSNCPCWTAEQLAAIDGNLIPSPDGTATGVQCTTKSTSTTQTSEQVVEGYMLLPWEPSPEGLAFATVDDNEFAPHYSCMYIRTAGTDPDETLEPESILYPLDQRADAVACQAEIVTHCSVVDP